MARTFRNRNTVPHGFVVRDDSELYRKGCCPTQHAYKVRNFRPPFDKCACHYDRWVCTAPRFRRSFMRCEKKRYRKPYSRQYRAKVRDRMAHGDWEGIPRFRRTSGWLTW